MAPPTLAHQAAAGAAVVFLHAHGLHSFQAVGVVIPTDEPTNRLRQPDVSGSRTVKAAPEDPRVLQTADVVVEVVSPSTERVDTTDKVADYARAGVPEYWIVEPGDAPRLRILKLSRDAAPVDLGTRSEVLDCAVALIGAGIDVEFQAADL